MCVPHFVYRLIRQWTTGLLPPLAIANSAAMNIVSTPYFEFFGVYIYSEVELIDHTVIYV